MNPPPPASEGELYWRLELNHQAATLSLQPPYDTLTLRAVPKNVRGEPLSGSPAVQYTSRDLDRVRVSPQGVMHAVGVTAVNRPVTVLATLTVGNLKHVDSVMVQVVDNPNPPVLGSFSIHPVPPDSAKIGAASDYQMFLNLVVRAADTGGVAIPNLLTSIRPSDPVVVNYNRGLRQFTAGRLPGVLTFYASTTAFGVTKVDTLSYRIGWPVFRSILVRSAKTALGKDTVVFFPTEVRVGTGAMVSWYSTLEGDVTFAEVDLPNIRPGNTFAPMSSATPFSIGDFMADRCSLFDPSGCTLGGNITLVADSGGDIPQAVHRVFAAPGTYEYHSAALGASGRIIVVDER